MEFQTQARWRTVLAVVGVALLASQWFVALFQWPGDIPLHRIYDIPAGETMYILVAVATVLFLIGGYGSVPDRVFIIVPMSVFANIVVGMSVDRLGLPFMATRWAPSAQLSSADRSSGLRPPGLPPCSGDTRHP